jgi:hypothetical protein
VGRPTTSFLGRAPVRQDVPLGPHGLAEGGTGHLVLLRFRKQRLLRVDVQGGDGVVVGPRQTCAPAHNWHPLRYPLRLAQGVHVEPGRL